MAWTAQHAGAAVLRLVPLGELAARVDAVAIGTVASEEVGWNQTHDVIVTRYRIDVERDLAGRLTPGPVTVARVGGEIDGLALSHEGMAHLAPGERVALFLVARDPATFVVAAMRQGVLRAEGTGFARDLSGIEGAPSARQFVEVADLERLVALARRGQ